MRSIKFMVVAAVAIGILVVAGCGGGDDDDVATAAGNSGVVSAAKVNGTQVLADSKGQTLYSAKVERDGRIRCTGACLSFWEPVTASANQAASASDDLGVKLDVVKRPDGKSQLALDGRPLYSFKEEGPGKLQGNGFVDKFGGTRFEWEAATTNGGDAGGGGMGSGGGAYSY